MHANLSHHASSAIPRTQSRTYPWLARFGCIDWNAGGKWTTYREMAEDVSALHLCNQTIQGKQYVNSPLVTVILFCQVVDRIVELKGFAHATKVGCHPIPAAYARHFHHALHFLLLYCLSVDRPVHNPRACAMGWRRHRQCWH